MGIAIYNELELFLTKKANNQPALIYFTGHGFTICDRLGREKGFLATSNCKVTVKDNQIIKQDNALPLEDLNYLIEQANLSELVLLLDACHSGNFIETHLIQKSLQMFEYRKNYYLITASRFFETAKTIKKEDHSVFSCAVIEGLSESNKDETGKISCDRLFDFVNTKIGGKLQTPMRMGIGGSITLVKHPLSNSEAIPEIEPIRDNNGEIVCPYQGLNVFTAKEKVFFFGRQRLTENIKQKLENFGVIPIIGASGSGKSSVVYAGVMAWLEVDNQEWCILPTIKPGIEPLSELRRVFKDYVSLDEVELKEIIEDEEREMSNIIEFLPNSKKCFLFIDQFEEIFTICRSEDDRRRFIELITDFRNKNEQNIVIAIAMRADFLDRCLQYQSLCEIIQHQAIYMPPLEGKDRQDIIIKPAERQGYRIESDLLLQLLSDVGRKQGFLPLLEFALLLLWEKRDEDNKVLTLDAYKKLGEERSPLTPLNQRKNDVSKTGLTKALNIYAEKVYNYQDFNRDNPQKERTEIEKELIKLIFLRLIRTNNQEQDTRQRQPKEILLNIANEDEEKQKILEKLIYGKQGLVNARLLVTGSDISSKNIHSVWVDLVHEALIEGWQRFKRWREEDRDLLRLSERLEDQRQQWLKNPIDENLMMGGLLMQVRQQWEKLQPYLLYPTEAAEFYRESDEYEQEQREKREELEIKLQKMSRLTYLDGLTETYNRRFFQQELQKQYQLTKENSSLLCLILADIDYFKHYNDTYGHLQGDECLKRVAKTLKYIMNSYQDSSVCRFGGEEFTIILPNTSSSESEKIGEKILKAVHQLKIPHKNSPIKPYVTLSLGIATVNSNQLLESFSMQDLIMEADNALYQAKQQGQGC
ncbi:nSTAND1 domain-containing NTPase [Crocosphaera chwakensis]|nr:diguanylate cyclase [Crocosphaera chwakensis]